MEEEKLLYVLIFSLFFAREAFADDLQQAYEEGKTFAAEFQNFSKDDQKFIQEMQNKSISEEDKAFTQEMQNKSISEEDKVFAQEMLKKQPTEEDKKFAQEMLKKKPSEEGKVFAKKMVSQMDFQKMTKDLEFLVKKLPESGKGCKNCSSQIENIDVKNPDSGIFVFVSFSMPKASLIELNNQAQKYNATLVMKGIYKNSFHEMRKKILEISPDGLSINIDPKAFEKYNIKQVPTFVLVENNKEINRLSGNVSLDYAHEKLLENK